VSAQLDVAELAEVAPLLRRIVSLDPGALVRLRRTDDRLTALVQTPFDVLAARSIQVDAEADRADVTLSAAEALSWIDGDRPDQPEPRDADWRGPIPPETGWQRIDQVPDEVIRSLVRAGATTLQQAAEREGVPGASPRAEVADVLLDTVVLTVSQDEGGRTAEVTLRVLSALTRLGFLARDSHAGVDRNGRWIRVTGSFGTVFRETAPSGLSVVR
jgi:hypothetical protein